nr:FGGY-family carbohydrate kinase [Herbiconiux sp. VKM Ac-1786]
MAAHPVRLPRVHRAARRGLGLGTGGTRAADAALTLDSTRGDLYRATLEATAFGVRHNVREFRALGGAVSRTVAVGGGTQGGLWTQIVSDVTGLEQLVPSVTIGPSFGAAYLAASSVAEVSIEAWSPIIDAVRPNPTNKQKYDRLFSLYLELYEVTKGDQPCPSSACLDSRLFFS